MRPPSRNLLGGLLFVGIGIATVAGAILLPMGTTRLPGPGALPLGLGVSLLVLGAVLALSGPAKKPAGAPTAVEPAGSDTSAPDAFGHWRVALAAALILAFVAALPVIGFPLGGSILMIALYGLGAERPFGAYPIVAGVLTAIIAHVLFVVILGVPMPAGRVWG